MKIVSCHTADSKPVKQEINGTVILPPLVFRVCGQGLAPLSGVPLGTAALPAHWAEEIRSDKHFRLLWYSPWGINIKMLRIVTIVKAYVFNKSRL
jgi:hypothetical protein